MSFNYGNLNRNSMHGHGMVPLLNNGTNYMSQLASANNTTLSALTQSVLASSATSSSSSSNAVNSSGAAKRHLPPSLNDNPLDFMLSTQSSFNGTSANKPQLGAGPMDLENENEPSNSLTQAQMNLRRFINGKAMAGEDDGGTENTNANKQQQQQQQQQLLMGNEMFLNGMLGFGPPTSQGFMMLPSMMMDPALALQMQFPMMSAAANSMQSQSTAESSQLPVQVKEIINCNSCTLFPPNPNAPPPTIRDRPLGCRTVFVGGLPESITEDIIREIFESCGEITTLRLSKKNFCHIRFVFEASVDSAIYLSGYRIRIGSGSEPGNCGRLHVDYAQARDDQYEWECKQRQYQREQRHRERLERDRLRSVSPPPVVHYTEHEATTIVEKLKNDESFMKAVQTLIVWLERGDCSKKNANIFYSMIQSTNAHVRRLNNDKNQCEEDLKIAKEQYRKQMLCMTQQFNQIEKVFNAASHKKVWDHFSKAQRKNIDHWKKLSTEIQSVQIDDDEMEMSDDERDYRSKRSRYDTDNLKEENDSLRCQVEAYKNEMNLVKTDVKCDSDVREKQIKVLQETIRNLQTQLIENKMKEKEFGGKISELEEKLKEANVKQLLLKTKIVEVNAKNSLSSRSSDAGDVEKTTVVISDSPKPAEVVAEESSGGGDVGSCAITPCGNSSHIKPEKLDPDEARIIGLVSTFLVVHPFGASPDYICSYLQKITNQPNYRAHQLEEILSKYRTIFSEEITGIGAKIERKWKFCGFEMASNAD